MANAGFDNERYQILRRVSVSSPRDRKIAELCLQGSNCAEIGRFIGLTRQRVRQILRDYELEPIPRKLTVNCEKCQKPFTKFRTLIVGRKHHFCSRECCVAALREKVVKASCHVCGTQCANRKNVRRHFCSQKCYHSVRQNRPYIQWRQGQRRARLVVAKYFDLQPQYIVHHEDSDNRNNSLSNLRVFASQSDHMAYHHGNPDVQPIWDGRNVRVF